MPKTRIQDFFFTRNLGWRYFYSPRSPPSWFSLNNSEMVKVANLAFCSITRVYFRPFLLLDDGSKNSILNWILKLNLVQQNFSCLILLLNKALNSSYCMHLSCFMIENVVLFDLCDYTKLNLVRGERNWMAIYAYSARYLLPDHQLHFDAYGALKGLRSFLLNSILF